MGTESIFSRAPTRIDLAGGTVDLWPLYLFLKNPVTINLGISLYAEATIEFSDTPNASQKEIILTSEDQNLEVNFSWQDLEKTISIPPGLELHYKLLRYFFEQTKMKGFPDLRNSFKLSTCAQSPAGAGLGGSSALSIALIGALGTWAREAETGNPTPIDPIQEGENFIEIVRDVETTVIGVPAGLQDYYAAMYGGLQSLKWGFGRHQREWLPEPLIAELQDRLILAYSWQSRNSGINNWALFKGFIDKQGDIREKFEKITLATQSLENALRQKNWQDVGKAITEEWQVRKSLASEISTPQIDQVFSEIEKLGPLSGKVCGAGGGGCFFIYLPVDSSEERTRLKTQVREILSRNGMKLLEFHGVSRGVEVQVNREGTKII
jgi:D-glycero-alpha-D-manno-heptose-7-phosphate kinase